MRRLVLAAVLVSVLPSASACTAPSGAEQAVYVGVERDGALLWERDSGQRFSSNYCAPPFRAFPAFDGNYVVWWHQDRLFVADATAGTVQELPFAGQWSLGHGLLLMLTLGSTDLRVRDLATGTESSVAPPADTGFAQLRGSLALATTLTADPNVSIYDAKNGTWMLGDYPLHGEEWPDGSTEVRAFNDRWMVGESRPVQESTSWWVLDLEDGTLETRMTLRRHPQSSATPVPAQGGEVATNAEVVDLRGDTLYLRRLASYVGAPYEGEAWSVTLPTLAPEDIGEAPPIAHGDLVARYRLGSDTSSLAPQTETTTDSHGSPSSSDGPASLPSPAAAMGLLVVALAVTSRRRRLGR